jgi:hypothetical protein
LRRFPSLLTAAALGLSPFAGDMAAAATCFTLQAELTHLRSTGGGNASDRERYERAYEEQINVIARTESRAREAGCFGAGFVFFESEPSPECATLVPRLREMEVNLARLDRLRMSGDDGDIERIAEIQGMMMDRGCGLPGADSWDDIAPGQEWAYDLDQSYMAAGTFRTVCVRTCDGYYFPISYSTTSEQFPADAQTCAAMCPNSETQLFYYPNPGGSPQTMVSIEGGEYADLPTAFRYRSNFQPSCSCGPAGQLPMTTAEVDPSLLEDNSARLPRARPAPGEDPETLANRAGNFLPGVTAAGAVAMDQMIVTPGGRTIRVVAPSFEPSDEQQEALILPIPTEREDSNPFAVPAGSGG